MRAPVLLAGLTALVLFPLFVRLHYGARVATVFAWLLAVSPIHIYFSQSLQLKASHGQLTAASLDGIKLLFGTDSLWLVCCGLVVLGGIVLLKGDRRLSIYVVTLLLVQASVIVITRPVGIDYPIVVARYAIAALPLLL